MTAIKNTPLVFVHNDESGGGQAKRLARTAEL